MHLSSVLALSLLLAAPTSVQGASTFAVAAQQQLPYVQHQAQTAQGVINQIQQQVRTVQQQLAHSQKQWVHVQYTLTPPGETVASVQPAVAVAIA